MKKAKKAILLFLAVVMLFSVTACQTTKELENRYDEIPEVTRNETGLTWPEGQALPSTAYPAETVDAIDIRKKNANEQTMLATFMGLINRTQPRIYLYGGADEGEKWAEEMGINYTLTDSEEDIILKYKDEIRGLVVWDPKERHTLNLATTYAGINDCIVVNPSLAKKYSAEPYNFPILETYEDKFEDKYEVYQYMYDNLWKDCTKRIVMGLSPEANGHLCHTRDLAVAAKAAVIWLDLNVFVDGVELDLIEEDYEMLEKFLADCTPGESYWVGWWASEGRGIELSSQYGLPTIPADFFDNYTLYAGCSRELDIPTVPAKPELEAKIYIAFTLSDGDNIQYCQHHLKTNNNMWSHRKRGEVPISWTTSPALLDAAPQMLNWYYKTATENDYLIAGPSGVGYTNPVQWEAAQGNNDAYLKFIELSDSYFRRTAFNMTTVWWEVNNDQAKLISDNWGSLIGYSTQTTMAGQAAYDVLGNGIIKLQTDPSYDGDIPRVYNRLVSICDNASTRVPTFIMPQIISWEAGVTEIVKMAKDLKEAYGDKVEFVRADHLTMLYSEYKGSMYNVSLQNDSVSASGYDSDDVAPSKVVDGSFAKANGWVSSAEGDKWLTIDLKENYILSRYILQNAATGYYSSDLNTRDFKVQVSTDGEKWTDIDVVKDNTSNILDKMFEEVTARYVRLYITDAGADGVARIQEFEVWGVKENATQWAY